MHFIIIASAIIHRTIISIFVNRGTRKMQPIPTLSDSAYQIVGEIGSGGGGVIYKAWHTRLQKYVILKELKSRASHNAAMQRNELEALKNVKSPYLPQVFDFLVENERTFTVMEFIEGESLDKVLARGVVFSQPQVIKWYEQLISAIDTIHRQNIYHRDIKPANIMLTPDGDVCLIDFNAALVSGNDVQIISRSLGYASPEQYEIFERYRYESDAPIKLESISLHTEPLYTVFDENTRRGNTMQISTGNVEQKRSNNVREAHNSRSMNSKASFKITSGNDKIDWKRTDIYSLSATIYHLLTGVRPPQRVSEVIPISQIGRFSEGIVYVIERSMRMNPQERFISMEDLSNAVRNIHKHDTRWRSLQIKKVAAMVFLPVLLAIFTLLTVQGRTVMEQEKEERFYNFVYAIGNAQSPYDLFNDATALQMDRIDPYHAMTRRFWDEGDIESCIEFIEHNLGNIARYQSDPEAHQRLGDIYNILGNCYYYFSHEASYQKARDAFEIAVIFVTENPAFYRDYTITLARTGNITEAEHTLEKARLLNLEDDSLNLLRGEIHLAKREYPEALERFSNVISMSASDNLRYRAYHASDDIFKILGQPERSTEMLSGALTRIPFNRVPEMKLRLANAYAMNGDYENTVILLEELIVSMASQFQIMQTLVIILIQDETRLDCANQLLDRMAVAFPADYRVPMYRAYYEEAVQRGIPNEERDYTMMKHHYDNAILLYKDSTRAGDSDSEMQQLELLIEQLYIGGWLGY